MSSVGEDLRTLLIANSHVYELVSDRVHVDHVPQEEAISAADGGYIWLSRSGTENLDCLDDAVGTVPDTEVFDLECIAPTLTTANRLRDAVVELHNYRGTMGSRTAKSVYFDDHSDDYLPQGLLDMDGLSVIAMTVTVAI